eukprot:765447-Hanusia_phi.AAC.1
MRPRETTLARSPQRAMFRGNAVGNKDRKRLSCYWGNAQQKVPPMRTTKGTDFRSRNEGNSVIEHRLDLLI